MTTSRTASIASAVPCTYTLFFHSGSRTIQHVYHLCPILSWLPYDSKSKKKIQIVNYEETAPTRTRYVYDIALLGSGGLERDRTLPASLQCPEGTMICLTVINTRPEHPSEPSRILQVVPVASEAEDIPEASLISFNSSSGGHQLQLTFHGGQYLNRRQRALFYFNCQSSEPDVSTPTFLWSFNGTHSFSWSTKHACPSTSETHTPSSTLASSPTPHLPGGPPVNEPPLDPDNHNSHLPPAHGSGYTVFPLLVLSLAFMCVCL
ncbi:unnamed protein product [Cyclocybe aegerita]|uniref:Autophagy-related protein 27 n=1 Tax=Cyclocybe aegerita TaxID=1973307 RepID=A0A8S0X6A6_CYCAE|nr:unnamed protein product [Cyclocybe aegerita]